MGKIPKGDPMLRSVFSHARNASFTRKGWANGIGSKDSRFLQSYHPQGGHEDVSISYLRVPGFPSQGSKISVIDLPLLST